MFLFWHLDLNISIMKSIFYGVNVDYDEVERMTIFIGCKATKFSCIYFSLPIDSKTTNKES